jgi:hypothetical protein
LKYPYKAHKKLLVKRGITFPLPPHTSHLFSRSYTIAKEKGLFKGREHALQGARRAFSMSKRGVFFMLVKPLLKSREEFSLQ